MYSTVPVNTRVRNYQSTSQRWFLRRVQNPSYFRLGHFSTISPHDISFLIVDSTTSNRVNRLFFLAAFHSAVTFNFLRVVVIAVFKRRAHTYVYHRNDMYGNTLRVYADTILTHRLAKKIQPVKSKDLPRSQYTFNTIYIFIYFTHNCKLHSTRNDN